MVLKTIQGDYRLPFQDDKCIARWFGPYLMYKSPKVDTLLMIPWNIDWVKDMSTNICPVLFCLLLCIKRQKLSQYVAKRVWLDKIFPIVAFEIPFTRVLTKSQCVIF